MAKVEGVFAGRGGSADRREARHMGPLGVGEEVSVREAREPARAHHRGRGPSERMGNPDAAGELNHVVDDARSGCGAQRLRGGEALRSDVAHRYLNEVAQPSDEQINE